MKVAVSIPDPIFREAERVSRRLRVLRSQLYSRALETYVRLHSGEEVTARINVALRRLRARVDAGWENPGLEVLRPGDVVGAPERRSAGWTSVNPTARTRLSAACHRRPGGLVQ